MESQVTIDDSFAFLQSYLASQINYNNSYTHIPVLILDTAIEIILPMYLASFPVV